ncbi:MAG: thiosulfate oxidation carrier protein SoxY [Betaproteobacteria bacterium HGW-Betaproteobacteria-22]|nr:MAG: thiosulfate oxidation carrier protein SoxY [Betaproteobacteria bacterium HGW-Betaproteobacteria-22]
MQRREFLLGMLIATVLIPLKALAAIWNKAAFESAQLDEASRQLAIDGEIPSDDIVIKAPMRAENGAVVQVEITSHIPNTEAVAIFVEKNPTPLIANYMFSHAVLPHIVTRIKMAETSDIKVVVKSGQRYFVQSARVEVLEGGCG